MHTKLDQIEAFIAVAQHGHFANAAKTLQLTPAAISKKIAELEHQLQVKLIHRTTRSCQLTEIGQRFFEKWLSILEHIEETEEFIKHLQEIPSGEIFVGTPRREYLIPHLKAFQEAYPKIILKIEVAERIPNFEKEKMDILLGMSFEPPQDMVRKKLAQTTYVLVGSPSYFAQHGMPQTPYEIATHRFIEHWERLQYGWIPFDDELKVYCPPTLLLNDSHAMRNCALEGLGVTRLHRYLVEDDLQQGRLISVLEDYLTNPVPIYLYYPYSRYIEPKLRCFIDFITPRFKL